MTWMESKIDWSQPRLRPDRLVFRSRLYSHSTALFAGLLRLLLGRPVDGSRLFQTGQKLDQVSQVATGEDINHAFGHGGSPFRARFDVAGLELEQAVLRGV